MINIEKYVENNDIKYYESKILITILEDVLGNNIDVIKKELEELRIVVCGEQIQKYLDNKFEQENSEIKLRIENSKKSKISSKNSGSIKKYSDEDIKQLAKSFVDDLTASSYKFDSFSLEYFNKYSEIVRNKAKTILYIIEKIASKDSSSISELISELDIQLDENGNIIREDIVRLITPFIYNYNSFVGKINSANDLETYANFNLSVDSIYKNGLSEEEIYPRSSIQEKNLYYDTLPGNIALTDNQKTEINRELKGLNKNIVKILLNW